MAATRLAYLSALATVGALMVAAALLLLIGLFSALSDYFFNLDNFINILRQISLLGIIAMGMTMVICAGQIDISVGAQVAIISGGNEQQFRTQVIARLADRCGPLGG